MFKRKPCHATANPPPPTADRMDADGAAPAMPRITPAATPDADTFQTRN